MTRGHPVYQDGEIFRYVDNDEPTPISGGVERPCVKCGLMPTPEGYDACLGYIEGAAFACCGHGVEMGYVAWDTVPAQITYSWDIKIGKWTISLSWSRPMVEGVDYYEGENRKGDMK